MIKALFGEPQDDGKVVCRLCAHECRIAPGKTGVCRVRKNVDGGLYSLNSDRLAAVHMDPIEKKPLYHFLPGSRSLSVAAMGCNFSCRFCQNHSLSMVGGEGDIRGDRVTPEQLVALARSGRAGSISYTYTEPTVFFELMLETARLARGAGLRNVMVSNGYMSGRALSALGPFLDGANIDLKAFREEFYRDFCSARLAPVLETIRAMKSLGIWIEITTLLIPGLNDDPREIQDLVAFLADLDPRTPWHVSRFFPQYRMSDIPPTEAAAVHAVLGRAAGAGLKFLYGGNMEDSSWSHTRCPGCGKTVIERHGYRADISGMSADACRHCGERVPGVWE